MTSSSPHRGEVLRVGLLVLLCGALFFFRLGANPLWEIDEGMHAATAAEMLRSGDWLTPRFNGEPFFDKPVLYTWLTAMSLKVFGYTELGARLPVALLGLGTVLTTYLLGRRVYGERAGFLGAAVLASAIMFVVLSRAVVHDMCLTFSLTLALALYYLGIHAERRRGVLLAFAWAAVGAAVLTKGPLGIVLPAGIVLVFLLLVWSPGLIPKSRILTGLAILLVVAGPWYLLMHLEHPDYLRYFIVRQHLGNVGNGNPRHVEPFWFYPVILVVGFFPWSAFLPATLFGLRPGRTEPARRATTYLWSWVLVPVLLFSAATSKLPTYVLPVFPALALLVGAAWVRIGESDRVGSRRGLVACSVLLFGIGVAALVYVVVEPPVRLREKYGIDLDHITLLAGVLAAGFGTSLAFLGRRRGAPAFGAVTLTVVVLVALVTTAILPRMYPYRSTKAMVARLDRVLPPGEELVYLAQIFGVADSALFYTERPARLLTTKEGLAEYWASEERVYLLTKRGPLAELSSPGLEFFEVDTSGKRIIVSNREGPLPSEPEAP